MNRRDFIKGAIILPNLFSLLPVLAKQPAIVPSVTKQTFGFEDVPGVVVVENVAYRWNPDSTRIEYAGTPDRINELAVLIYKERRHSLRETSRRSKMHELCDEFGYVTGIVVEAWDFLNVELSGIFSCNHGIVESGYTGISQTPLAKTFYPS